MTGLLTAAQMRALEQDAMDRGAAVGLDLMERAGRGVVEAVFEHWPELAQLPHHAVVLCGPGNNGGDGFVVARLLQQWGWRVEVHLFGDPAKLLGDARVNHDRWCAMGKVHPFDAATPRHGDQADLFVDALFGTGLTRPLSSVLLDWARERRDDRAAQAKTVAVDVPSGLCSDSGRILGEGGEAVWAALTVTFHARKLGHVLNAGPSRSGRTVIKDIGLTRGAESAAHDIQAPTIALGKADGAHKYSHGHALILSGPPGAGGAARLAARAALRVGAGLVSLCCEAAAMPEHAARLDAIMIKLLNGAGDLARLLEDDRLNALCLGPGLGLARARNLVALACARARPRGTVLDADALSAFQDAPQDLFAMLHEHCVLTPHAGEFSRLFPDLAEQLNAPALHGPAFSKADATRAAAARAGCAILFKGPDTVIAAADGRVSIHAAIHERAAPWLATAGSGDVLAGIIAGLLARGAAPMQAAETAAWLHVEAARSFGPGLIAEDLPEELPKLLRALCD